MEYPQQDNIGNESEKPTYIRKKTNAQILPPMGMVFVFCTLMLIGRTVKQNFCPGYSALLSKQQETELIPSVDNSVEEEQHLNVLQTDVCFKNSQLKEPNSEVCNKEDIRYKSTEENIEEKAQKLSLEQIEKLNDGNLLNKQRTSEPIIYLFVFIFIYLLLKSIADINSHYKKKMSGDNNMRRCSLQSYAQIHRYDQRRASRGIGAKLSKFH